MNAEVCRLEERVVDMDTRTKHVETLVHAIIEAQRQHDEGAIVSCGNGEFIIPASCNEAHAGGQCLVQGTQPWPTYQQLLRTDSLSDALMNWDCHDPGLLHGDDTVTNCTKAPSTVGPCAEGQERQSSTWTGLIGKLTLDRGFVRFYDDCVTFTDCYAVHGSVPRRRPCTLSHLA